MGPGKVFAEDACAFLAGSEATLATAPVVA